MCHAGGTITRMQYSGPIPDFSLENGRTLSLLSGAIFSPVIRSGETQNWFRKYGPPRKDKRKHDRHRPPSLPQSLSPRSVFSPPQLTGGQRVVRILRDHVRLGRIQSLLSSVESGTCWSTVVYFSETTPVGRPARVSRKHSVAPSSCPIESLPSNPNGRATYNTNHIPRMPPRSDLSISPTKTQFSSGSGEGEGRTDETFPPRPSLGY